ncbi:MAG: hypothetical protein IJ071_07515 [Ruminococcus sp.]|nr:hypothetical protein [Ruminococcus sp.]
MILRTIDLAANSEGSSIGTVPFVLIVLLFAAALIGSTVIAFRLSRKRLSRRDSQDSDDRSGG